MHIIHIAAELAPVAKVGGLADVALGLCRELTWKGHDVDIIVPKYDCMDSSQIRDFMLYDADLRSFYGDQWYSNTVWVGWVENMKVYFIEPHHPSFFFNRGCFYGCSDDNDRYLFFARAAMDFIANQKFNPEVIHIHDWQTAVIAPLYRDIYLPQGMVNTKVVFTIHNIEYQGKCNSGNLDLIGLDGSHYLTPESMQDPKDVETINLIKGAIVYSDAVTTVSPTYAQEVKTPEGGKGLDNVLQQYSDKFSGILNGLDYSYWNPEIDRYLPAHFSARELPKSKSDICTLDKKAFIKRCLREKLLLEEVHRPIFAFIARLVPQKGIEMIERIIPYVVDNGGQFILLGTSPIPEIHQRFQHLKHYYQDNPHIHLTLHYNEELAHMIYAGSDMFFVPSIFEPCGLTQMIALKYGSIPVVRKTGGLADTIFDVEDADKPFEQRNGFVFGPPNSEALAVAVKRSLAMWFHEPEQWRRLMIHGMNIDFSWNLPADAYLKIYHSLSAKS